MVAELLLLFMTSVRGKVVEDNGPLPGVEVSITSVGGSQTTFTDGKGQFIFPALEPGPYEVHFKLEGFGAATQRGMVKPGENILPDQKLTVVELIQTDCSSPCSPAAPESEWDRPACSDYDLDTSLDEAAGSGDRSAIALLRRRHETVPTRDERLRIAGMLLHRVADDSPYWRELAEYAENAVRFGAVDDGTQAAYAKFCEERGLDERYVYVASGALAIIGRDARSRPLLLRALESNDEGLLFAAICGLGEQHDLDSLPVIEKKLESLGDHAHEPALGLFAFASDEADRVAFKYIREEDRQAYLESRAAAGVGYRMPGASSSQPD